MVARDILVIGAGVIGLTTAVLLAEADLSVTVIADQIPGHTSLAASASWGPYHVEPYDKVRTWGAITLATLTDLAQQTDTGVKMISGVEASRTAAVPPDWAKLLPDVRRCDAADLPAGFRTGWRYTVPVVDMPRYLSYLYGRLHAAGGVVEQGHFNSLAETTRIAPIVINCTGLGARALAVDASVFPIQGQLVVVRNPGISTFFSEDTGESRRLTHYLPHGDTVVLGGTADTNLLDFEPSPEEAASIVTRCAEIQPLLRDAEVLEQRIGHRPTRPEVRVETEELGNTPVIHNYGHGGAGVSLSWGCATTVLNGIRRNAGGQQ
jgi:D-amino-acid oxidase